MRFGKICRCAMLAGSIINRHLKGFPNLWLGGGGCACLPVA